MSHRYHGTMIQCADGLWNQRARKLIEELVGGELVDEFTRPGGVRRHRRNCPFTREVLRDIALIAVGLHGSPQLNLVNHCNCADYGGQIHDLATQEQMHTTDLLMVGQMFRRELPLEIARFMALSDCELASHYRAAVSILDVRRNLDQAMTRPLGIRSFWLRPSDLDGNQAPALQDCTLYELE